MHIAIIAPDTANTANKELMKQSVSRLGGQYFQHMVAADTRSTTPLL